VATYAIGDVQGCYDELRRLLERLHFDPGVDRLWLAGDLVSRGPRSLDVLRFVKGLGDGAVCVLGNHDLHLLAVGQGNLRHYRDDSLDGVLAASDREELLDWLRCRPLFHHSAAEGCTMLHAGLPPQWDLETARRCAQEVESTLCGDGIAELMQHLYGNKPDRWSPELSGIPRLRFTINCLTRLRYCSRDGTLGLKHKGPPGTQAPGLLPWFEVPGRASAGRRIICGHWSTLGLSNRNDVWSLDTGCLWGGRLTAVRLYPTRPLTAVQVDCPGALTPDSGD
jgi:bis(5'-nucleosyl)-tetraphosphatase (symmetrical)